MDNKNIILVAIAFLQIFLVVNSVTIQAKEIGDNFPKIRLEIEYGRDDLLKEVISFLKINGIGGVSAQSAFDLGSVTTNYADSSESATNSHWACCFETFDGAICQDVPLFNQNQFCSNALQTKCSNTAECAIGCCYDPEQGVCSTRSTKYSCEANGGVWENEESCLTENCRRGCCMLGPNVEFVTEKRCQLLSMMKGYEIDFKTSLSELDCIVLEEFPDEGACILAKDSCVFTTKQYCVSKSGEFHSGKLCSNEIFNNSCEKQFSTGCFEGKDEIYWFDSCGNRENIYSSDRDFSWNNGFVLTKEESCGYGNSNIDSSDCGNCNLGLGSVCSSSKTKSISDGENICKSLKCIDEKGNVRENGESWCVYDGVIGDGLDVVGSRHWKRICQEGEVVVEPCADYRGQICVQSEMEDEGKTITQAQCVVNDALSCLEYNSEKDKEKMAEKCKENPQCVLKNINIDKGFKFDMCVGQYPRGFDLSYTQGKDAAKAMCAQATQECIVYYEKKISGWDCVYNCHCEDPKFVEQMNDLCISMGDCGGYVNTLGKGTDSFKVTGNKHKVSCGDYSSNSNHVEGQCGKCGGLDRSLGVLNGKIEGIDQDDYGTGYLKDTDKALKYLSMVSGGLGILAKIGTSSFFVGKAATTQNVVIEGVKTTKTTPSTKGLFTSGGIDKTGKLAMGMDALASVGFAMGIGSVASMIANKAFGLSGDAALMTTIAGVGAGIATGIAASIATTSAAEGTLAFSLGATTTSGASGCLASGPFMLICAAIVVIVVILTALTMKLMGIGDTKEKHVKFDCLPWQAPFGSEDCSKCNEDPLKPCSKYRCESLGKACGIINENSENPKCIAVESDDGVGPEIKMVNLSLGYSFEKTGENSYRVRTDEGECIPEFTTVLFGIETSEYAQCKMDIQKTEDYDSMSEYLLEGNIFEKVHTGGYMMPSIGSMEVYNISGDIREKFANSDIYIRCIDSYGNYNKEEVVLDFCLVDGPDKNPPVILKANPVNGAYLKKDVLEVPFSVFLNEPAECRIDSVERDYEVMQTDMDCKKEVSELTANGWECKTNLVGLSKQENKFYIRCKDQPWLEGREDSANNLTRNVNEKGTQYILYGSKSELKLEITSPKGNMEFGQVPAKVILEVKTSEGFNLGGGATCKYGFKPDDVNYQFKETGGKVHRQTFDAIQNGEYNVYVVCKDDAGNEANDSTKFKIILDDTPPEINRIYQKEGQIYFNTDEEAICYYTEDSCSFDVENSTKIDEFFKKVHVLNSPESIKYSIKCKDKWNNINPYCAAVISKSEL